MLVDYTKPLVIFGTGPFSELMLHYFREDTGAEVAALTVDRDYIGTGQFHGLPVLPFEDIENTFPPDRYDLFLAIGYKRMRDRERMFHRLKSRGYKLVNFVSSHSLLQGLPEMGENNVVLGNAVIEPFCLIGHNNIFWSGVLVCHGSRVGNHNFLASGAILGGDCQVGDRCFLGFGATVLDKVNIADESLLGARSLVLRDTETSTRYMGIPAMPSGTHREEGIVIVR